MLWPGSKGAKLALIERRAVVDWVTEDMQGHQPVTVTDENAPDFLCIGLPSDDLLRLTAVHPSLTVVKAECNAVPVASVVETVVAGMKVFNGRAGLEVSDNYRASANIIIPGAKYIGLHVAIERAARAGNEAGANARYRRLLRHLSLAMLGLAQFMLY